MSDTETFKMGFWELAPERWVDPDERKTIQVVNAEIVGEQGDEYLKVQVERLEDE